MENHYGISVKNKYELFLDEGNLLEILKEHEANKANKTEKTKKGSTTDKDSKTTKNKTKTQAEPVATTQSLTNSHVDIKSEKHNDPGLTTKLEDKPKKVFGKGVHKDHDDDQKPLKDRGNRQLPQKIKDSNLPLDSNNQTEFGTFESSSVQDKRGGEGGGQGFGRGARRFGGNRSTGGSGSNNRDQDGGGFRQQKDSFENRGPNERRPPRRGGFGRPDRNNFPQDGENENTENGADLQQQDNGLSPSIGGNKFGSGNRTGFGNRRGFGNSQNQQNGNDDGETNGQTRGFGNRDFGGERRGGFRREFNGENRGYGNRRNFDNRSPRRGGRRGGGTFHSNDASQDGPTDNVPSTEPLVFDGNFGGTFEDPDKAINNEIKQSSDNSFGVWGAEEGEESKNTNGPGFGGNRGFNRRGGRFRGRIGYGGGGQRREFNRRGLDNGQGIKSVEKRDGTGSHNWGTVMDDLEAQNDVTQSTITNGQCWADQVEANDNKEANNEQTNEGKNELVEEEPGIIESPEIKLMTLDEYKASLESSRVKAEFNIRKSGEGCQTDAEWKKMYVLSKKKLNENEEEEEYEEGEHHGSGKTKHLIPIEITFADSRRGSALGRDRRGGSDRFNRDNNSGTRGGGGFSDRRGERGNRRGGEFNRRSGGRNYGGGGYGGDRRQQRERAPNVEDELDFPSLDKTVPMPIGGGATVSVATSLSRQ